MTEVPLHITIISASDLRAFDADGKSDPYVKVWLKSNEDNQLQTEIQNNNLNPVWNADFDLVTKDPENDEVRVCMYDKDILRDDRMIDEIHIPINEIISKAPGEYVFDQECNKTDKDEVKPTGKFHFTVKAIVPENEQQEQAPENEQEPAPENAQQTRDINLENENENEDCVFSWGTYGSDYSTNFTGYTDGDFESLGQLTPDSQTHHHHHEPHFEEGEIKPTSVYTVQGTLHGFSNLISTEEGESDVYATLQIFGRSAITKGKGEPIRTPIAHGDLNPEFNYEFKFDDSKRGSFLVINVIQSHDGVDDIKIGTAKIDIKDAEGEKEYPLQRPKDFKGKNQSFGKVKLTLHSEKTEDFAPTQ